MSSSRRSYMAAQKLRVIHYAEAHGNCAAEREFDGISEMNIRRWHKQKSRLQALPKSKMAERGHVAAYPELEKQLLEWISERRQEGGGVSISEVRVKALTLVKAMPNNVVDFKASYG